MRRLLIFLLILLLAVLLAGWYLQDDLSFLGETAVIAPDCLIEQPAITTQCTVKIGIINTFSSGASCFSGGTEHKRGYEMALNEINNDLGGINGCQVELVQIDDKGNSSAAGTAVTTLTAQDIPIIIGAYSSGATLIAAEEADRQRTPLIVPSASSELVTSLGYEWVFRINADSTDYVSQAMKFTSTLNDLPTIAVIYENTVFGESAAVAVTAQAEEQGVSVVAYEVYQPGAQNLVAPLSSLRSADPDVVYLVSNSVNDSINLLKTSRSLNLNPQLFIANAGAFISPDFLEQVGAEAEYVVVTAQWAEDVDWHYEGGMDAPTFADHFRLDYGGDEPGMRSVQTYTSLLLAKEVIERAQATPGCTTNISQLRTCIRTELRGIDLKQTLFGEINFDDSSGQNSHPVLLVQIVPEGNSYRFATVYPEQFRSQEVGLPTPIATGE